MSSPEESHKHLGESLNAIFICMSVAAMLFSTCYVYKNSGRFNWMVAVLLLLVFSALVRIIERFGYTETIADPQGGTFGVLIGIEIAITWSFMLVSEFYIAMKYFMVSSQMPAVIKGQKSFNEIKEKSKQLSMTLGIIANIAVSIWPGILYTTTYYKNKVTDIQSVFFEFQLSIWLNALCRLFSLLIFGIAICRIHFCIKQTDSLILNKTMTFMNWTLVILSAFV